MQFKIFDTHTTDEKLLTFLDNHQNSGIWHYPRWLSFQIEAGIARDGFLFCVIHEGQIVLAGCCTIKQVKKILTYGYIQGGILYTAITGEIYDFFCCEIKKYARKKKLFCIQSDSIMPFDEEFASLLENSRAHKIQSHLPIPGFTTTIDLGEPEETILKNMKSKGRYNIRLAAKKGVTVREGSAEDIPGYYDILKETTSRDKFSGHPASYYSCFLNSIDSARLLLAYHEDQIIAGGIFTYTKQQALYYYGASSNKKRNLMAPYLVQWEAMKIGKSAGCRYFDFMGIADPDDSSDPLNGVTDFKLKFGGDIVRFNPSYVIIFKPAVYFFFSLLKKVRALIS